MKAVELFAGLGGFAEGARPAAVQIVWAANHWRAACDAYFANHPDLEPACQDLHQADFSHLPPHDCLLGSSACQGHCWARGKEKAYHDATRATAWAFVSCAEMHRQPVLVMENVPEFLRWVLFPAWKAALEAMGYVLSINILDAADHGVPQHRVRVVIIATLSRFPFELAKVERPHVPFEAIIDPNAGLWGPVRTKCLNTRRRWRQARKDGFGPRFVMPYYGNGSGLTGRSLARPLGTITTRDRWALVADNRMRMLTVLETQRAMGFRDSYLLPANKKLAKHLLGNAVPPVMVTDVLTQIRERL